MASRFCEVALPVPLRSAFTYAVPPALNGECLIGRRLVVPFGRRPIVGVGIAESDSPPTADRISSQLKEIARVMDSVPALTPNLLTLGQWISRYYAAPIGEAFHAMLPPEIELRHQREYDLTESGRAYLNDLNSADERTDSEQSELAIPRSLEQTSLARRAARSQAAYAKNRRLESIR